MPGRKDLDDFFADEATTKSKVVHVRVDPDMYLKIRRAALKADRKPCDWVRRAITHYLAHLAKPEEKRK